VGLKQLTKAVLERALEAEMTEHLGYEKHDPAGQHQGNRVTKTPKKLCRRTSASWNWKRRAIGNLRSSPKSCPNDRRVGPGLTTR